MHTSKRVLAGVVAAVALLAGGGSALADDGGNKGTAFRDAVAAKLGVTPEQLQAAYVAVLTEQIDAKVASGKLSAEKAAQLKQAIADGKLGKLRLGFHKKLGKHKLLARGAAFRVAADYLGLQMDALKAELKQGKSLGDVANATPGKSSAGLVAAMLQKASERLDKAVAKNRITAERKQAVLAKAKERIDELVAKRFAVKAS